MFTKMDLQICTDYRRKLEQIDRGNKTLAEFEVEIANTPFLMDIIPLIKHYLSLKSTEITPRFLPSRQN